MIRFMDREVTMPINTYKKMRDAIRTHKINDDYQFGGLWNKMFILQGEIDELKKYFPKQTFINVQDMCVIEDVVEYLSKQDRQGQLMAEALLSIVYKDRELTTKDDLKDLEI